MPRFKFGFSLIELMVVVSLFGLAASLITASYLSYERNQRVRSGAATLKGDLRLIQNKVTSGDKGPDPAVCDTTQDRLGGWYLIIAKDATSYTFGGVCIDNPEINNWTTEVTFGPPKTVNLRQGTKIRKIFHDLSADVGGSVTVFFKPLSAGVEYFQTNLVLAPTNFYDDTLGVTRTGAYIVPVPIGTVSIEVSNLSDNRCHYVKIAQTAEVYDEKSNCS